MALALWALIVGTAFTGLLFAGNESDEGTSNSEKFYGTEGDDRFYAAGGNDLVAGNAGDDRLHGGAGSDWLIGANGADTLMGDAGDDVLIGGPDTDVIIGGAGDDFVEAADVVDENALTQSVEDASSFRDIVFEYALPAASDAGDVIDLGPGDDTVVLGSDDIVTAGDGADELSLGDWIALDHPAKIEDFNSDEDILVYTYNAAEEVPEVTIEANGDNEMLALVADGVIRAYLNSDSGITSDHIRLVPYAPAA